MSNYTKENLIPIPPEAVPAGTLAIKVGNEIFTPGNIRISSGDAEFYKCASVDTASKTWTGYKAVLQDGGYSFETELTEGLFCDKGYTPAVGGIYSADALVGVRNLWQNVITEGLVFRASFNESLTAETGQELVNTDGYTINELNGKSCLYWSGTSEASSRCQVTDTRFIRGGEPFTFTGWFAFGTRHSGGDSVAIVNLHSDPNQLRVRWWMRAITVGTAWSAVSTPKFSEKTWLFVAITGRSTGADVWVDGTNYGTITFEQLTGSMYFAGLGLETYIRDVRFYDRALNADEIALVRKEGE